jgi:hypothetical protein
VGAQRLASAVVHLLEAVNAAAASSCADLDDATQFCQLHYRPVRDPWK